MRGTTSVPPMTPVTSGSLSKAAKLELLADRVSEIEAFSIHILEFRWQMWHLTYPNWNNRVVLWTTRCTDNPRVCLIQLPREVESGGALLTQRDGIRTTQKLGFIFPPRIYTRTYSKEIVCAGYLLIYWRKPFQNRFYVPSIGQCNCHVARMLWVLLDSFPMKQYPANVSTACNLSACATIFGWPNLKESISSHLDLQLN